MIQRWTQPELDFIRDNIQLSDQEIAAHLGRTTMAVRNKRQGIRKRFQKVNAAQWTTEQVQQYKEQWQHSTDTELATLYNVTRRAINEINNLLGLQRRRNIKSPALKEKLTVGTITTRKNKGKFYKWIRTQNGWMPYHTWLWLQAGREIPEKHAVTWKDGDTLNCALENLVVKTKWQIYTEANPDIVERRNATRRAQYSQMTAEEKQAQYQRWIETKRAAQRRYRQKQLAATAEVREQKRLEREAKAKERQRERQLQKRRKAAQKARREREKQLKEQQRLERKKVNVDKAWAQQAKANKKRERCYEVRTPDLTEKVPVRINAKTVVYVNRGADVEKVIAKYKQAS